MKGGIVSRLLAMDHMHNDISFALPVGTSKGQPKFQVTELPSGAIPKLDISDFKFTEDRRVLTVACTFLIHCTWRAWYIKLQMIDAF